VNNAVLTRDLAADPQGVLNLEIRSLEKDVALKVGKRAAAAP